MGSSSKPKVEVSEYRMSLHLGFCYAVDYLLELFIKEKSVWKGTSTSNETLRVNLPNLFGGIKKEGGVVGAIEVMHGRSDQVASTELAGRLGTTSALAPGFRDILSLFFRGEGQGFLWSANYPYLHAVWAKVCRTKTGWYDAKSSIGSPPKVDPATFVKTNSATMSDVLSVPVLVRRDGKYAHVAHANVLPSVYFSDMPSFPLPLETLYWIIDTETGTKVDDYKGAPVVYAPPGNSLPFLDQPTWNERYFHVGNYEDKALWVRQADIPGKTLAYRMVTCGTGQSPQAGLPFLWSYLDSDEDVVSIAADIVEGVLIAVISDGSNYRYIEFDVEGAVTKSGTCASGTPTTAYGPSGGSSHNRNDSAAYDAVNGTIVFITTASQTNVQIWSIDSAGVLRPVTTLVEPYPASWSADHPTVHVSDGVITLFPAFVPGNSVPVVTFGATVVPSVQGPQMNPAHIIREVLTNTDWGLGIDGALIDDASFTAAADTLYDEGFGLSLQWTGQSSAEDFINDLLAHIDATYGNDPATGKFYIKLIRGDYDPDDLDELTDDHVTITSFTRNSLSDTSNEVVVTWTNPESEEEQTVTVHDIANYSAQGVIISTSRNYHAVRTSDLALRCAMRELGKVSQPVATFEVDANRMAIDYKSGDVVKVTYPEYGLNGLPCRVMSISRGKPGQMAVKMTLMEDVFNMPASAYAVSPGSGWEDESAGETPINEYKIESAPYYLVAKEIGDAGAAAVVYPETYAMILAVGPGGGYDVYTRQVDPLGNTSFSLQGSRQYAGTGTLAGSVGKAVTSTITVSGLTTTPTPGMLFFFGEELCVVESVSGATLSVRRGVLDTVPVAHADGERLWFFTAELDIADPNAYSVGQSVYYRLVPDNQSVSASLIISTTMSDRITRPYRPGNVKLNGNYWPGAVAYPVEVTWSHRNRTLETSIVSAWSDASTTPEAGTTYTVSFDSDVPVTGITGTSHTITGGYPATVKLHLDFDSDFSDSSVYSKVASTSGSPSVSDGQLYLNGTSNLYYPYSTDYEFGTGDFTVSFNATPGSSTGTLISYVRPSSNLSFWKLWIYSGQLMVDVKTDGDYLIYQAVGPLALGVKSHIAMSSVGGVLRVFINGEMAWEFTDVVFPTIGSLGVLFIGSQDYLSTPYTGLIDAVEIEKGVGRYAEDFTPSTAPRPQSTTIRVKSVRDGFDSFTQYEHTMDVAGYGHHYGKYYGGV